MGKNEQPQKEINISTQQLEGKTTLYIATQRQGDKKEFFAINIESLDSILITTDKTIALELFNGK